MARETLTNLCIFLLVTFTLFASINAVEKKEKECVKQEGSVLIPGIGRYMPGSHRPKPSISGLDNSGPAAAHARYIPGNDDTFVPNPGYEVPNPGSNLP
ncbi:putative cell wall protein [Phalaenopsis equestris]|uniref:putative cell wall protein n=1 Tax=Phalaenopsis equestris TaxID=78828 RepID=UPI0009E3E29D|nr:putative cell wall protein [Phalaenopsis equestris]